MELQLADHTYVVSKMRATAQRNVLRRLLPIFVAAQALGSDADGEWLFSSASPIATSLAKMSDEDSDYVFHNCFNVVRRKTTTALVEITTASGDLMFQDITLPQQFAILFAVLKENYSDFFPGGLGVSNAAAVAA